MRSKSIKAKMGEWKEYKLGDVAILNYGKGLKETDRIQGDVPVYSSAGLTGWHNEPLVNSKGIIIGRKGTIGKVYLTDKPFYCIDTAYYVSPNDEAYDLKFMYYLLLTLGLEHLNEDSAVPGLNRNTAYDQDILLPPLPEQKSIASILSSLDDKIDLLHRQNKTLEALAETLFRQWFLPASACLHRQAGQAGVKPACPVGREAEGLETKTLNELIVFDPREKVSGSIEYTFYDMKCLSESSMAISEGIKRTVNSGSSFRNGDTLLAKITPCLENGKTGFVMNLEENELARGSTEFVVMRAKDGVSPYYVYCLARYTDFKNTAILSMTGTSGRQRVQTSMLKNYEISYSKEVMKKFHEACHPHFLKIKQNQNQIRTLTRLRDTLLPKLMSGEVRVKNE